MAQQTGGSPLSRFMRFTTRKEPVLSVGVLVAAALYVATRFVPGLTDDDLQLLALIGLPIATAVLARLKAWSPSSVERAVGEAYQEGQEDGVIQGDVGVRPRPFVPVDREGRRRP